MTTNPQTVLSVAMLGSAIWAILYLLPRARRKDDKFGVACALICALLGLFGWLFIGIGTR
jgi:hypothetical protein